MNTIEINPMKNSNLGGKIELSENLKFLPDGVKIKEKQRLFRILTPKDGDKRVVWNRDRLDELNEAKELFDELISEGMVPYIVGLDGKSTGIVMEEFDADAEEVLFLPVGQGMLVGG